VGKYFPQKMRGKNFFAQFVYKRPYFERKMTVV
jgi:hypothetical protein